MNIICRGIRGNELILERKGSSAVAVSLINGREFEGYLNILLNGVRYDFINYEAVELVGKPIYTKQGLVIGRIKTIALHENVLNTRYYGELVEDWINILRERD